MSSFDQRVNQFSANMEARKSDEAYYQTAPIPKINLNCLSVKEVTRLCNDNVVGDYQTYAHLFENVDGLELAQSVGLLGICNIMSKRNNAQLTANMMEVARSMDKCVQKWKKHGIRTCQVQAPKHEFTGKYRILLK